MSDFTSPRITEKRYLVVTPTALTADGTVNGIITVANTYCLKVGQCVLFKQGATLFKAKIQKVISETQFIVIDAGESITTKNKLDMSSFLAGSTVELQESKRPVIDLLEIQRQVYEEEPTVALRTHAVDWLGRSYDASNPMPVQLSDGSIEIGTVNAELEVQLSRRDNNPDAGDVHDSVRLGNQDYELSYTANDDQSKAAADINALNRLIDVPHDDVEITTFNADGDPTVIEFRENSNLKLTLNLTYNSEGDLQRVQRIKP